MVEVAEVTGGSIQKRGHPLMVRTQKPIVITIDGPAGTGKSSVARALAERLGFDFLDTGAMYRAAALVSIERHIDFVAEPKRLVEEVIAADIRFAWQKPTPRVLAWGRPVDERIRAHDVEAIVSPVASIADLRAHLVEKQRDIAREHKRLVTEGRDQGSVVFTDAVAKFYLDARPEVRARRRADQARARGEQVTEAEILKDILERDESDSSRTTGPLRRPEDAHILNTSDLTFDQVVDQLEDLVRAKVSTL